MSAETDLLPLPEPVPFDGKTLGDRMRDYARANLAELQREVEGLRAEVRGLRRQQSSWERHVAAAGCEYVREEEGDTLVNRRAERLAEALRHAKTWHRGVEAFYTGSAPERREAWQRQMDRIEVALDQETTNG